MGATGHERNIRPTLGQEPTQIASEATAPHHDNTHRLYSSLVSHQSSAWHGHVKRLDQCMKHAQTILVLANCRGSGIYTPECAVTLVSQEVERQIRYTGGEPKQG